MDFSIKRSAWMFSVLLLNSCLMSMTQSATASYKAASLTIADEAGGATKWAPGTPWSAQCGSAFLSPLVDEYCANPLTASDHTARAGTVAIPAFSNGPARTKNVNFQAVNETHIDAINNGAPVRFSAYASAPSVIRAAAVSRDLTPTVGGIDVNNNGVRDDIEDVINKTYTDTRQRAAMMQYAAKLQKLLNSKTRESAYLSEKDVLRSLECTYERFGESSSKLTREVLAMTLNTKQRALAYSEAQNLSSGQIYDVFVKNPCDTR